jgi:trans-aconitate 2-methyltransferase
MPTWDPGQYLRFQDDRLRPALDLLARIPLAAPQTVFDLGCGPGNITRLLAERWPEAEVTGIDSSADMLSRAQEEAPGVELVEADIARWSPAAPADLIFSNAALHWLGDHERLLPRLMGLLAPGGVLAVQMPRNHASPAQRAIGQTVVDGPWRGRLACVQGIRPVAEPADYWRILQLLCRHLDIWETDYLHVLEGGDPVAEWTKGTALRPFTDALPAGEREAFVAAYAARVAAAYPREADGRTLFPFRRIFLIATRS